MIITNLDLQIEDIEWYGIDKNGRIAQFMSGGSFAALPQDIQSVLSYYRMVKADFAKDEIIIIN